MAHTSWNKYELLSYVCATVFIFSMALGPGVIGEGVDLYGTLWFHWWLGYSDILEMGFSEHFFYPHGKDIFAHTGNNFIDAIWGSFLLRVLGFNYYYPVFIFTIYLCNIAALAYLLKVIEAPTIGRWSAIMLWLFNPFVLSEIQLGRPTQITLCWSFLALSSLHKLRHYCRLRDAFYLATFVALQGYTYWFYGYFLALVLCSVLLCNWRTIDKRQSVLIALSGFITLALILVPALMMMRAINLGEVPGYNGEQISRIYEQIQLSGHPLLCSPVFLCAALLTCFSQARFGFKLAAVLCALFALEPTSTAAIILPFQSLLDSTIPFYSRLWFPIRWMAFSFIAIVLALSNLSNNKVALCLVLPTIALSITLDMRRGALPLTSSPIDVPEYVHLIDAPVIELPIGYVRPTTVFQTVHQQPTFGGMGENNPHFWPTGYRSSLNNPFILFLSELSDGKCSSKYSHKDKSRVLEKFEYLAVDWMMIEQILNSKAGTVDVRNPSIFAIRNCLGKTLGPPLYNQGRFALWRLDGTGLWSPSSRIFDWELEGPSLYQRKTDPRFH